MNKIFLILTFCFLNITANAKDVVVLVPGFFNSFTPEYFSQDIINSFIQKNFQVYIAKNLNPIGTIEDNGARLESFMLQVEKAEGHPVSFNLVGHSAGGFYSLWVANRQKFEIKTILTISTPYKGIEFVQNWLDHSFLFKDITSLAHLDGLFELTSVGVKQFIDTVHIHPKTKVFSFGGFQDKSIDITDAKNISLPLRVTSYFISEKSDGIVGFSSALGIGEIKTIENKLARQYKDTHFFIHLEHWEQVLDYRSFLLLGVHNVSYIQNEQIRFYSGLADLLNKN